MRTPSYDPAALEAQIGPRDGTSGVTSANRHLVQNWLVANGVPSARAKAMRLGTLSECYNGSEYLASVLAEIRDGKVIVPAPSEPTQTIATGPVATAQSDPRNDSSFTAPVFCEGFDDEPSEPVLWGEQYPAEQPKGVKGATATVRPATVTEQRRHGVQKRIVGSRWYRSSATAYRYPTTKPYRLEDTFAAIRAQTTRELSRPSNYKLYGDGENTEHAIRNNGWNKSGEELQAAIREARYLDWQAARDAAARVPKYRRAA